MINRTGDIWHIFVLGMESSLRYAYQADGPFDPEGKGHWFKKEHILLDPYAQPLEGVETWGAHGSNLFLQLYDVTTNFQMQESS